MSATKVQGQIVLGYMDKYPNLMKMTLARLIYKEHPEVFSSVDTVRTSIRYYSGSSGMKRLDQLERGGNSRTHQNRMPDSDKEEREDFVLPKVCTNCLIFSDVHIPYQDNDAIEAMITWAIEKRVNTVIMAGDIMDFYGLSTFVKDPRQRSLQYEIDAGYEFISYLRSRLPRATIYYLPGNHEYRYERYLRIKAPELLGVTDFRLDDLLHFADFDVHYLRHSQLIRAGRLFIGHGDEFNVRSNPVSPARTFGLKGKVNFIGGHFHVRSEASWRRADDTEESCWSLGCLCGLSPEYRPYNEWTHGFAHVRIDDDGGFRVFNALIRNGKVQ